MVTINDKLSLIFDVNELFYLDDVNADLIIDGDTYLIDETYKDMLDIFRDSVSMSFINKINGEKRTITDWMTWYGSDINDPMDIVIFLRYASTTLIYRNRYL